MRYDSFKEKIEKLKKVLQVVKRFRVLIVSVLVAITATAAVLMSTAGLVNATQACPSTFVYGEEATYGASAFLSGVSYE